MKQQFLSFYHKLQVVLDRGFNKGLTLLPPGVNAGNILIFCVLCLLCIGTIMVASASMPYAQQMYDKPFYFLTRQFSYLIVAFFAVNVAYRISLRRWFGNATAFMWVGTGIILLAVLLIGSRVNGSARWISISFLTIQPSEIAKFTMAVFTADYVVRRGPQIRDTNLGFLHLFIPALVVIGLIMLEPDLGASVVVVMTMMAIFFLAGAPNRVFGVLMVAVFIALAVFILFEPYRLKRLMSFANPWEDAKGTGYQLTQSLMAFGRGEWFGTGLGHSIQKLSYLPEAHTDFMLAITAEELGFIGISIIFSLSFLMVACCMRIGYRALANAHLRSGYLAYGIATIFFIQICVNAGMNMGLLPTKGLTLPFISYGGSSLLVCAFMIGVIFRINKETTDVAQDNLT